MKKNFLSLFILICGCPIAASGQKSEQTTLTVEVSNDWSQPKIDEPVVIPLNRVSTHFRIQSAKVMDGTTEIPSQLDDLNGDRRADELALVID